MQINSMNLNSWLHINKVIEGKLFVTYGNFFNLKLFYFWHTATKKIGYGGGSLRPCVKGCYRASDKIARKRLAMGKEGHIEHVQLVK